MTAAKDGDGAPPVAGSRLMRPRGTYSNLMLPSDETPLDVTVGADTIDDVYASLAGNYSNLAPCEPLTLEAIAALHARILAEASAPLVLTEAALEPVPPAASHLAAWWNRTMAVAPPVDAPPFVGGPRGAGGQKPAQ